MAGEAHPDPSRTRKLSPRAPMVLRSQSVGEQDAAGHQGAFCQGRPPPRERRGPLLVYTGVAPCIEWGPRGPCRPLGPHRHAGDGRGQPPRPGRRGVTGPWERAVTRCVARLTAVYMRRLHRSARGSAPKASLRPLWWAIFLSWEHLWHDYSAHSCVVMQQFFFEAAQTSINELLCVVFQRTLGLA